MYYRLNRYPVREFVTMQDSMNRLFSNLFSTTAEDGTTTSYPAVDLKEKENELSVRVSLPGVDPEKVELSVHDNILTIKATTEESKEEGDENSVYHLRENSTTSYYREVRLPFEVDADKAEAESKHGILTVTLPKAEVIKPKTIAIKTNA